MSTTTHKAASPQDLAFAVITVSDSCARGAAEDSSGKHAVEALSPDYKCIGHLTVPDDVGRIKSAIYSVHRDVDFVVTTGGTGISPRDVTIDAVRELGIREIPGFGELFRRLGYDEIGTAAMLSGALAGVLDGKCVFCLPGSEPAVRLGISLISHEVAHIIKHARE
ncbi:MogA/MoaB family molybdenum cofactor biosynthesis protein [archaeon]|nr:MAG: MogA/MoaB family molybdenum cofactor biosynthesis protein [archaeon]